MASNPARSDTDFSGNQSEFPAFDVLCGVSIVADNLIEDLKQQGFIFDPATPTKLVLDIQIGFALQMLQTIDRANLRLIVVTYSICPEYWEDLWDLHPDIFIVNAYYHYDFADAIQRASRGEQYRIVPKAKLRLNSTERKVLACLATGLSNQQIAEEVTLQEKTVTNMLTAIYKKLGLTSRAQAILYYWGIRHNKIKVTSRDVLNRPAEQKPMSGAT